MPFTRYVSFLRGLFFYAALCTCTVCRPSVTGYKGIQVDRDINMSPRYSQHVSRTNNMYPVTCVRRHVCIRCSVVKCTFQFRQLGPILRFRATCVWCKRGITLNDVRYSVLFIILADRQTYG